MKEDSIRGNRLFDFIPERSNLPRRHIAMEESSEATDDIFPWKPNLWIFSQSEFLDVERFQSQPSDGEDVLQPLSSYSPSTVPSESMRTLRFFDALQAIVVRYISEAEATSPLRAFRKRSRVKGSQRGSN